MVPKIRLTFVEIFPVRSEFLKVKIDFFRKIEIEFLSNG